MDNKLRDELVIANAFLYAARTRMDQLARRGGECADIAYSLLQIEKGLAKLLEAVTQASLTA